ncbi:hypothetical protein HHI36_005730 [Cryptolaemus montrouzieri]|uniref:Group XV phospholipase A2 n=1 Tax=Cryptolaemus montrouzieri TaxID=559131 RepID=A0ABD2NV89_9CUCU
MLLKNNLKFIVYFVFFQSICCYLNPVILIPGDGGAQIEAKLNKTSTVHYLCDKITNDYFNIWLNMELLVPVIIDCWIDNLKLIYDNQTRTTRNNDGVSLRIPGFGLSETVEWLDPSHAATGSYFNAIANLLVSLGHERNITLRGAPYDFRKAPNENEEYFNDLKILIEDTYQNNLQQPVILIAHSMGGPMSLQFLNRQTQEWKDKYIKSLVTLSGAWGGSVKAIKVYAIGDDLGSFVLRESTMRLQQITSPSLAYLLPSPLYWKSDEVLVQTDRKNFSLSNLKEFFYDISYPAGWEMKKDTEIYQLDFKPPGVEVHCLYGTQVDTVERLYYKPGTWLDGYPTLVMGNGDGTVNLRSLEGCLLWRNMQSQNIYSVPLAKVDHLGILSDKNVLQYISDLVNAV